MAGDRSARGGDQNRRRRRDETGRQIDPPGIWEYTSPDGRLGFEVNFTGADGKTKWRRQGAVSLRTAVRRLEALRTDARRERDALGRPTARPAPSAVAAAPARPGPVAPTVLELHQRWRAQLKVKPKTLGKYDAYLAYRLGTLADRRVDELVRDDIEEWLEELQSATTRGRGQRPRPLSDGTVHTYARIMLGVLRRAAVWWPTVEQDTLPLAQLDEPDARRMALSDNELAALLHAAAAAGPVVDALIALGAFTGLRIGEVAGLRWGEVDLQAGVVRVHQQLLVVDGLPVRGSLKSKHSKRHVMLPVGVGDRLGRLKGPREADDFVFAHCDGTPMRPEHLRVRVFYPVVEACGVGVLFRARATAWGQEQERLVFHHLRHTYASLSIARGTDVALLARQLGHRDSEITQKVYRHFYDQHHHGPVMRQALDAELGRLAGEHAA